MSHSALDLLSTLLGSGAAKNLSVALAARALADGLGAPRPLAAQETGFVAGAVVDDRTGLALVGATITVMRSRFEALTGDDGQFLLDGLSVATIDIRIASPGYVTVVEQIEMSAADFLQVRLHPVDAILDELLVATGRARAGFANAGEMRPSAGGDGWRSALDLLQDGVPGVEVRRGGGNVGAGARIIVRGTGSFQLNDPDIYIDGVRIHDTADPSRASHILDLIPAETVERVRVLKGASAGGTYADTANGVILIETRRGGGGGGGTSGATGVGGWDR
jgi:hypothetical protein